jgi:hypothetical protein
MPKLANMFLACLIAAVFVTAPVFAAGGKQNGNGKFDIETCRKLAREKFYVKDGRALNKAVKPAVQRCMQSGPSAI